MKIKTIDKKKEGRQIKDGRKKDNEQNKEESK